MLYSSWGPWSVLCSPSLVVLLAVSVCLGHSLVFSHIPALPLMAAKFCLVSLVGTGWEIVSWRLSLYTHITVHPPSEGLFPFSYPVPKLSNKYSVEASGKILRKKANSAFFWTCCLYSIALLAHAWPWWIKILVGFLFTYVAAISLSCVLPKVEKYMCLISLCWGLSVFGIQFVLLAYNLCSLLGWINIMIF